MQWGLTWASLAVRLALAACLLSAVADRFGLWGGPGVPGVAWGAWPPFEAYTARLNPWAPAALVPLIAWVATAAEVVLGVLLVLGLRTRLAALGTGLLTLVFALSMWAVLGVKAPLDYGVFAISAGAFLLWQQPRFPLSLDRLLRQG